MDTVWHVTVLLAGRADVIVPVEGLDASDGRIDSWSLYWLVDTGLRVRDYFAVTDETNIAPTGAWSSGKQSH